MQMDIQQTKHLCRVENKNGAANLLKDETPKRAFGFC
jgi:hypothetical protein